MLSTIAGARDRTMSAKLYLQRLKSFSHISFNVFLSFHMLDSIVIELLQSVILLAAVT